LGFAPESGLGHFGVKLPENPPENLKNQDGEQKKKGLQLVPRMKIWAEDRKFSEKTYGHPMEQTFFKIF
jgi:hypothetical protein